MGYKLAGEIIDHAVSELIDQGVKIDEIYGAICVMKRTLDTLLAAGVIETIDELQKERAK